MNIFVTDPDPTISAEALDDKRVIKMCLESAQIICTALSLRGFPAPYKPTHTGHPCVKWAAESHHHISWLLRHHIALANLYEQIYGRTHASYTKVGRVFSDLILPNEQLWPWPNCAQNKKLNIDCTYQNDVHLAYKKYLILRWQLDIRPPVWTKRNPPKWRKHEDIVL